MWVSLCKTARAFAPWNIHIRAILKMQTRKYENFRNWDGIACIYVVQCSILKYVQHGRRICTHTHTHTQIFVSLILCLWRLKMFHQMDWKYYLSNSFEKSSQAFILFLFFCFCSWVRRIGLWLVWMLIKIFSMVKNICCKAKMLSLVCLESVSAKWICI